VCRRGAFSVYNDPITTIINVAGKNLSHHAELHMQTEPADLTVFPINY
jgi:prophage DNA circulation protein